MIRKTDVKIGYVDNYYNYDDDDDDDVLNYFNFIPQMNFV